MESVRTHLIAAKTLTMKREKSVFVILAINVRVASVLIQDAPLTALMMPKMINATVRMGTL
jgi:hypothetical protein